MTKWPALLGGPFFRAEMVQVTRRASSCPIPAARRRPMRIENEPASERTRQASLARTAAVRTSTPAKRGGGGTPDLRLEFFFDLVFVVAIDQLARRLQHGVTGPGTLVYLALHGPIWWAWVGFVIYTDRFAADDLGDRLLTLVQIGATVMIAHHGDAVDVGSRGAVRHCLRHLPRHPRGALCDGRALPTRGTERMHAVSNRGSAQAPSACDSDATSHGGTVRLQSCAADRSSSG
jgi:hypothetical protein